MPALTADGTQAIREYLQQAAQTLPAVFIGIASKDGVLLFERDGAFDPLNPAAEVKQDDVYWFASTTKLLTAVSDTECPFLPPSSLFPADNLLCRSLLFNLSTPASSPSQPPSVHTSLTSLHSQSYGLWTLRPANQLSRRPTRKSPSFSS